ncbi:F-type conjugal transfer pilus assembly protein TraB [Budviciaceae bacterium BWR-B9]|uniref:F-type conjugal transfer pilus assembly protein TraB n=1 Tax=Limnobaculum allomyrinae TaxID=2791986 RepID=A0ABS1IV48_9GAMM|nr:MULTISPECIES: F-type conjugal transfer pilus assembly protein TraB [Limnobaculum]MBK5145549.1 F-type conjugal transfer pilus assembly protein TraB [Limnobaculum allomyrinae]MBV7693667.1 F-type conjugal transfer pilus assembly protein TraB [Limnobaculum sp. M2-1]
MANINARVKKKQMMYAIAIVVGLSVLIGGGWYWTSQMSKPSKKAKPAEPAPDLTGVVNTQFDNKVQRNVMIETQAAIAEQRKENARLAKRLDALEKNELSNTEALMALEAENQRLKEQLNVPAASPNAPEGEPGPGVGMPDFIAPPTNYYPGKGDGRQPAVSVPVPVTPPAGQLERTSFDYSDNAQSQPRYPYIPSGSFARSLVIEGADTNASVTGNENTAPMQVRLTGKVQMPNDKVFDLTGCFISLSAYGDVSSERAIVRTRKISCDFSKGHSDALHSKPENIIDQDIAGHVNFMGKNGIKGDVVMRNGKILGWAFGAGFIDGIGEGMKSVATPAVGVGATASVGAGDVMKSGIGGGSSKAASTLSDYYIKRAEQYHPIIPIGAGNEVTIVFQDGFQLQSIAEASNKNNRNKSVSLANIPPKDQIQSHAINQVNQMLAPTVSQGVQP